MATIIIMGMIFDSDNVPDFGSIYAVKLQGGANFKGRNDYGLFETDVSKLDLITNAAPGSTALCDDTGNLYRLTKSGWVLFGENSSTSSSTASLNVSPVGLKSNINSNYTDKAVESENKLDFELFDKADDLAAEPIAESLTDDTSLDTTEQIDEPEILENDLFTKPDDLTVEPIKDGEELR